MPYGSIPDDGRPLVEEQSSSHARGALDGRRRRIGVLLCTTAVAAAAVLSLRAARGSATDAAPSLVARRAENHHSHGQSNSHSRHSSSSSTHSGSHGSHSSGHTSHGSGDASKPTADDATDDAAAAAADDSSATHNVTAANSGGQAGADAPPPPSSSLGGDDDSSHTVSIVGVTCGEKLMKLSCALTLDAHHGVVKGPSLASLCYHVKGTDADTDALCLPLFKVAATSATHHLYRLRGDTDYVATLRVNYGPGLSSRISRTTQFRTAKTHVSNWDSAPVSTAHTGNFTFEVATTAFSVDNFQGLVTVDKEGYVVHYANATAIAEMTGPHIVAFDRFDDGGFCLADASRNMLVKVRKSERLVSARHPRLASRNQNPESRPTGMRCIRLRPIAATIVEDGSLFVKPARFRIWRPCV